MIIKKLWLNNFRSYSTFEVEFSDGLTALIGKNGVGKTNLVESLAYLSTLRSFRNSPTDSLIKKGSNSAVIRAEGIRDDREVLIEVEIAKGRSKVLVNKQKLKKNRDLLGALRVSVFSPDDLSLIKEGPSLRRDYLDDLAVAVDPANDVLLQNFAKVLKQRNALLKQAKFNNENLLSSLDVWDQRLGQFGDQLLALRMSLVKDLLPFIKHGYQKLSESAEEIEIDYVPSWNGFLIEALEAKRDDDLRRTVTTVGPHRDDVAIRLNSLNARTEASQGEQRTLALALRLASHNMIEARIGEPPLLLLDDVLSELDNERSVALLQTLPEGQTAITSAIELPKEIVPDLFIRV